MVLEQFQKIDENKDVIKSQLENDFQKSLYDLMLK